MAYLLFSTILRLFTVNVKNAFSDLFFRNRKDTRVFQGQEDTNVVLITAPSSTKPCLSFLKF